MLQAFELIIIVGITGAIAAIVSFGTLYLLSPRKK